jgi:D-lactate dehydrogenase (cytochrome)
MPRDVDKVIAAARDFLGERISVNEALRGHHSHGEDTHAPHAPDAVAFVETTGEAARLLALAHADGVPVVPFGAGTSLEGHVTPVRGGISLDLSRMTAILQ